MRLRTVSGPEGSSTKFDVPCALSLIEIKAGELSLATALPFIFLIIPNLLGRAEVLLSKISRKLV